MHTLIGEHAGRLFTARIGAPYTVCEVDEAADPGRCRIHPLLKRLPGGRLVLTVNLDGDLAGAEHRAYASDDDGATWREYPEWPGQWGALAVLENGETLLVSGQGLYATKEPGTFLLPMRRSRDGGLTWGPLDAGQVNLPLETDEPIDRYHPPQSFLDRSVNGVSGRDFLVKWQKPQPPPGEQEIRACFGSRKLDVCLTQVLPLGCQKLLAFMYLSPRWGEPHITVCLASDDAGRTWAYRSTPRPFDPRFARHGYFRHKLDGLCEPSCARLATGELFLVMRLGSYHPLYTTVSADEGHTWQPQADQRPGYYYEGWPARPIAVHGILPTVLALPGGALALASGRPDATLSFSFDHGRHWPWTHRFLEDNKPEEQGTYNNTMALVGSNRLLYLYDHGGYHKRPPEFTGPRRIVGHMIEVESR